MSENDKKFFINMRRDSGELRFFVTLFFCSLGLAFLIVGYLLLNKGLSGQWTFAVSGFKGLTLYVTSATPGAFALLLGAAIPVCGLPKALKNL